jgi:rubrerythrin
MSDSDQKQKWLTIGGVLIIVLAAGYIAWSLHKPANSVDLPNGTFWVCKKCDNHFALSEKALNEHQAKHYGEPLPCPKCGSTELIRSIRCEKCGEYYPMNRRGADLKCPKCGTPASPQPAS